jgi:adenylate kinase
MASTGQNIILFGPPGVGKGAQANLMSARRGLVHLSTGDVLRDEIARGTELGRRIEEVIRRGEYADDETVIAIILSRLDRPEYAPGFVMDGFPRTIHQAERFDALLAERDRQVDHAVFVKAEEETILRRLGGRLVCQGCGQTYHREFRPPRQTGRCDRCGGEVVRRHDDDPATHRERLRTYLERTQPLVEYYRGRGLLREVDGEGSIEEVAERVEEALRAGRTR